MPKRAAERAERAFEVKVDQFQPDGGIENVTTIVPEDWFLTQIAMNEVGSELLEDWLARRKEGQESNPPAFATVVKRENKLAALLDL